MSEGSLTPGPGPTDQPVAPGPVDSDSFTRAAGRQLLLLGLATILGLGALLWILGKATSASDRAHAVDPATGTITLNIAQEPPQLDSTKATDQVSGYVLDHVTEGLLVYGADGKLEPGVAERWEINERGATFHLRRNALWSDGEPVTAHDFVFAWRKVLEPANASEYSFILYPIRNAEAINRGDLPSDALGVRALDDWTLEVDFERPIAFFDKLVAFSTYRPVREDFYRAKGSRYGADATDLLYNGPFKITRWVHGASLRMERNEHYWRPEWLGNVQVIDIPYLTSDTNAVLNLYKDGKIALAGLDAETLKNALEQRWQIKKFDTGSVFFLEFNHRPERVTRNHHLRKAMQLVYDQGELVYKVIKVPGNLPGSTLFPAFLRGTDGPLRQEIPPPPNVLDIERAREHLAIARRELGVDTIPPLSLLVGDSPTAAKQAEYTQDLFRRTLGLTIKIDAQTFKQRLAKMTSGEFDLVAAGWGPDYNDPLTFGDLFASWNLNNRGRYANDELDAWVRVAQSSLDQRERVRAFGEIQRILHEDAALILNYEQGLVYVQHPQLGNVIRRAVGGDPDYRFAMIREEG